MASRSKTQTTTRAPTREKIRKPRRKLTTIEESVLRMRHGIGEAEEEEVGDPPEGCSEETVQQVRALEARILERARSAGRSSRAVKQKIIQTLKQKD